MEIKTVADLIAHLQTFAPTDNAHAHFCIYDTHKGVVYVNALTTEGGNLITIDPSDTDEY